MKDKFQQSSFLFASNAVFIEELYRLYLSDPNSVDSHWQTFFQNIGENNTATLPNKSIANVITDPNASLNMPCHPKHQRKISLNIPSLKEDPSTYGEGNDVLYNGTIRHSLNTLKARAMITAYRNKAHYLAKLDPLDLEVLPSKHDLGLSLENFSFNSSKLDEEIEIAGEFFGINSCNLQTLVALLDKTYSSNIAVEFDQVKNEDEKAFLFEQFETQSQKFSLSIEEKRTILQDLVEIEGFEQYLHTKFPGAKRFSIEGGETSILALNKVVDLASQHGVCEVVIGMAHRGRLSSLTKVMGKPYKAVMAGFISGKMLPDNLGVSVAGDVKYHLGYSSDRVRGKSKIHLSMADNPSHLEAVNPIVAGKVRAKQDYLKDAERKKVMGVLIHGDAAFCGQGVVAESLSMSGLTPYNIGGILHIVINNQVGFTANSVDTRMSRYSTEFAKIIAAPILHVNGDDAPAVLLATGIAMDYRNKFGKDIVIEIICYRKYGHNEGDEPMYTQGPMYSIIKDKESVATLYANELLKQGAIDSNYFGTLKAQFKLKLDNEYELATKYKPEAQFLGGLWSGFTRTTPQLSSTGVSQKILKELGLKLCKIPKDFPINPKLTKLFEQRATHLTEDKPIDWATAEQLAFASLLSAGVTVRLTGQDSGRGTFSHRHSVLHSQIDNRTYVPLNNLSKDQAIYEVADSNLSEYAVLGFEYGYSLVNPKNLVIWEAQFGDFANGAQIIFDQFISSSETKWLRMSGLVVLLPHGFEGQGPEHSSARLERFLQLSAEDNIQVAYPTTPASFFHLLRRQINSNIRKPLIVMTPKSLLRHKLAVSTLEELDSNTSFSPVLDEVDSTIKTANVKRVVLCSGKVYYDLLEARLGNNILNTAIIRLEQLYPFENAIITQLLSKYASAKEFIWCQEEPKNMGAWQFINPYLNGCLKEIGINSQFQYIGRYEAASPAVGSSYMHNRQQKELVKDALS